MSFIEDSCPATMDPEQFVTCIDNRFSVSAIKNLSDLPKRMHTEIRAAKTIRSSGFQELLGYDETNTIMWSAGGYWHDDHFVVLNYGSHNLQWDGTRLTSTIKEYV